MNVFETSHLTKKYGKNKVVLDDVNLTVREGDIYGLVGRNGAGKLRSSAYFRGLRLKRAAKSKSTAQRPPTLLHTSAEKSVLSLTPPLFPLTSRQ